MAGLRLASANLLPHALSTEKLYQVTNLVRKKTNQALQNRIASFNGISTAANKQQHPQIDTVTMIIDGDGDDDDGGSGLASAIAAVPAADITKILSRTETFTIDPNEMNDDAAAVAVNNATKKVRDKFQMSTSSPAAVAPSRKMSFGVTTTPMQHETFTASTTAAAEQTHNNYAGPTRPDTLRYATHNVFDDSANYGDITMVGGGGDERDEQMTHHQVLSSTLLCVERLVDVSGMTSVTDAAPAFPLMDVTQQEQEGGRDGNSSDLLYMTRDNDGDCTILAADALHHQDECMEVDERPHPGDFSGNWIFFIITIFSNA